MPIKNRNAEFHEEMTGWRHHQRLASSIPGARFEIIAEAGHFPQLEQLDLTLDLVGGFVRDLDFHT